MISDSLTQKLHSEFSLKMIEKQDGREKPNGSLKKSLMQKVLDISIYLTYEQSNSCRSTQTLIYES